jgi:hypothetical protein
VNNRNLWIGLGAGAAGLLGYGVLKLLADRGSKKRKPSHGGKPAPPGNSKRKDGDRRPEKIPCPACGEPVGEYEFFCPACGHSFDKKG